MNEPPAAPERHLVLLVHGINTRAHWIGEIKPVLEQAGFLVEATSYGKFGVPRFLLPFRWLRKDAIERVVRAIAAARMVHNPSKMSVISHSFGTYVIANILADYPGLKWDRIIFCGSVVRDDFRLDLTLNRFTQPLLNEVGSRDFWPALAESVTWGYGSVGSNGYNDVGVETRWHRGLAHSGFLTPEFCEKFWVPFLNHGSEVPGDPPSELPWWIRTISALPLRWLQPVLLLLCVLFLVPLLMGDPSAKLDEAPETRVSAFTLHLAGKDVLPGYRFWSMPDPGRWDERYLSGQISRFKVNRRSTSEGCDGQIAFNQKEPSFEVFIPDKGCDRMVIKFRRRNWISRQIGVATEWIYLSDMNDINVPGGS
jgi:pimeloyl-ACP methyl ester carboxylesterase